MSIDILNSTPLPFSEVADWVESHTGVRPSRTTLFRWRTRGSRGRKLATYRVGGRRVTTVEALIEFFSDEEVTISQPDSFSDDRKAAAYLDAEGLA
jgi:hypothetical protein